MRTALIIGIAPEGEQGVMLQPCDPRTAADTFKRFLVTPPEGVAEIQLWESGSGITKRKRFAVQSSVKVSSIPAETVLAPVSAGEEVPQGLSPEPVAETAPVAEATPGVETAGEAGEVSGDDAPSLVPDSAPRKRNR